MHRNGFSFLSASHRTAAPFHGCWQTSSRFLTVPWLTTAFTEKWNFSSLVLIRDMCASPLVSFHKHALHLKDGTPPSHPHPSHCQYLCCRLRWNKYAFFCLFLLGNTCSVHSHFSLRVKCRNEQTVGQLEDILCGWDKDAAQGIRLEFYECFKSFLI